jgi:predicted amidophosphoribosyltransferase
MELKLCPNCKRPYLESEEFCPRCPQPLNIETADSYGSLGCVLLTVAGLAAMVIFWMFVFLGAFFH